MIGRMDSPWGVVRVDALGKFPIVTVLTSSQATAGCLWEIRPFHYHLCSVALSRWLRRQGQHTGGSHWVEEVSNVICPSAPCQWYPSHRQAAAKSDTAATGKQHHAEMVTNDAVGSEHMATSGWLLAYILHWAAKPTNQAKAYRLLQGIIRSVCQEATSAGSSIVIKDGCLQYLAENGAWDRMMDEMQQLIKSSHSSITDTVAKDLESPPAVAAVLWTLSSFLTRRSDDIPHNQHLLMLRDLTDIIMACVAAAMDTWARNSTTDISTATLLENHPRGRARPRRVIPILKHRLAQRRRPQAAVTAWRADGANITMSPEATMEVACARYNQKVRETMQGASTVELLMDASRFGGTDNEIVVIFCPAQGIAAYAPPQVRICTPLEKLTG